MRKSLIQLAFNTSFADFQRVVAYIPRNDNIILEAGTPLIKQEGIAVIRKMRAYWGGKICADMKIADGAEAEVAMARNAGATSVTALGNASYETLRLFIAQCKQMHIQSVVDMINETRPLHVLWKAQITPDIVLLHRGRDEENSFGSLIQYKDIAKIKGKWDILLGAAGGIDEKELQSAIFNNADIVVVNIVPANSSWKGIRFDQHFQDSLRNFLTFVGC